MNETTKPHSKLGIASCVIGLITFLIYLLALEIFFRLVGIPIKGYFGIDPLIYGNIEVLSFFIVLFVPIPSHLIGLILGVVPLLSSNQKKLIPIFGVVLNLIFGVFGFLPWLLAGYRSS